MTSWIPMESNPEVMTKFLHKLGVPKDWCIVDVYGLEPDLLALVPKPVLAVILLYPLSKKGDNSLEDEEEVDKMKDANNFKDSEVFHMKQYIHNACGTIALIHSVANNQNIINLQDGFLKTFLDDAKNLSFTECGKHLMESHGISTTHKDVAQEGQTEVPSEEEPVYHHFVAFIQKNGILYELDGRKSAPINHGTTSPETLLEDAARVCKEYMARDPEEVCFTVLAFTNSDASAL
ncbi:ubiquitin carboxyl-terminal hydrolase isoform X1 [Apis florea]|uniref:ubiquitin carboxyl-terminal hydrolase isoform X1 n=1 Tax=Apis florea TaxID=7463 RepID=UPI000252BC9C|nr:ubiquitin carboxyl-terminal hydrolase isoform X1 [Apis florea]XP_031773440.1 ubiquitin carboxyl-terminal hydrolase isoform X1 [Apis florea]XP_031773441.1 ubiquitin carboxyl-terminal hydrolase isoform X1 [Apis florea]